MYCSYNLNTRRGFPASALVSVCACWLHSRPLEACTVICIWGFRDSFTSTKFILWKYCASPKPSLPEEIKNEGYNRNTCDVHVDARFDSRRILLHIRKNAVVIHFIYLAICDEKDEMLRFNIGNWFHCPSVQAGVALLLSSFDTIQLFMIKTSHLQYQ